MKPHSTKETSYFKTNFIYSINKWINETYWSWWLQMSSCNIWTSGEETETISPLKFSSIQLKADSQLTLSQYSTINARHSKSSKKTWIFLLHWSCQFNQIKARPCCVYRLKQKRSKAGFEGKRKLNPITVFDVFAKILKAKRCIKITQVSEELHNNIKVKVSSLRFRSLESKFEFWD